MSDVTTSSSLKIGEQGDEQTVIVESFIDMPQPPSGAKEIQQTHEDGKYVLRYTFVVDNSPTTYTITGAMSQEPLATHPMFQQSGDYAVTADEWKKWKLWDADPHDIALTGWTPDGTGVSDGMKKYYAYRNRGIDDFLLGTVTMRVVQSNQTEPSLSNLGRIETPPYAPYLENGRNWLLVGIDGERIGPSYWKVTREYRASAAGGWDQDIYSKT